MNDIARQAHTLDIGENHW